MRARIRVTDYHYGGHVSYVRLRGDNYELSINSNDATLFTNPVEVATMCQTLGASSSRIVDVEHIVDHQLLKRLSEI